jgi:hypothetical protein
MADTTIPDKPTLETHDYQSTDPDDNTTITFTYQVITEVGLPKIHWTATWDDDNTHSGTTDELDDTKTAIVYQPTPTINGDPLHGTILPDDLFDTLQTDLEDLQAHLTARRQAEREAKEAQPLTFELREIEYQTGSRTKHTRTARALVPSKDRRFWTSDERDVVTALKRELGDVDDKPRAGGDDNPLAGHDEGTQFAAADLVDDLDEVADALASLIDERETETARRELRDDHPELWHIDFDPSEVRDTLATAAESGESAQIMSTYDDCNGDRRECSLDRVVYHATPEGSIRMERTHLH